MRVPVTTSFAALPLGLLALLAMALASIVATAACLTAPPPDLQLGSQPPTILHVALQPPESVPLDTLPNPPEFVVPVTIEDPSLGCFYSLFVDATALQPYVCVLCPMPDSSGVAKINLDLSTLDRTIEHTIKFTVGSSPTRNADPSCLAENDTAIWYYEPNVVYDAGALEDGAFPDAGSDGLPFIPESGVDP